MRSVPCFNTPLLNAVSRDLAGWPTEKRSERSGVLRLSDSAEVTYSQRQKRLFMASIQSCEFSVEGPVNRPLQGKIRAHQSGWFTRHPVTFVAGKRAAADAAAAWLNGFPNLQATLSELDYRRFSLMITDQKWCCTIEPWGASEVVCKLPPLRRYLRLEPQQRMLLLSVMNMVSQAMGQLMEAGANRACQAKAG
ncbi:DUF3156 family protein [[Enterobacter] lignolyticus]|uniref:Cytoplasmic protein n=1 Tax=[Enterobacter] lignolyticus TaxID=1334193 RepID=A0A806XAW1_9ENTR|nr:DUF3156 family protein [[Enterobacter] lignolyticus]ALR75879.1 cytoplasmic protein [[Enterobacter] lignolyticus]